MRSLLVGLALAACVIASGCGGDGNGGGGKTGAAGGIERAAGFDGKTITLGVITPLSGPGTVVGFPVTAGGQVWFDYYNAERGGIAGKYKIDVVERDHRYDAPTAVQAYNRLKNDVVLFAQILGTPVINALLPQLKRDKKAAFAASLDAEWIREPNLIPVLAPYQVQAINAMDFYLRGEGKRGDKTMCSMIQDDPYGQAGQEGMEFAAKELHFDIATTARFRFADKDFTGQIGQLRRAGCEMVFLVGTPGDVAGILGAAAQARFSPRWIGQFPTWHGSLAQSPLRSYLEKTFWVVGEGPEHGDTSVPGMREFLARLEKYPPSRKLVEGDFFVRFGYTAAKAVTAVLEKAVENRDLSSEGVLRAITQVGPLSFGGLIGDYRYGPIERREPPRVSTMFRINARKPFGLEAMETNFGSEAARKYRFP